MNDTLRTLVIIATCAALGVSAAMSLARYYRKPRSLRTRTQFFTVTGQLVIACLALFFLIVLSIRQC